jgi:glycosyltransferase involved in cell wall biosynthesis
VSSVDVVIPCYNYARYLRDCVDSVLCQRDVDVRVLVIDDCSSDETPEVGRSLAAAHSRVEFRRHEVNAGHLATYNEGLLGWSTADYVVLLSADDLLVPGSLGRAVRIMDADPAIGMVYGRSLYFETTPQIPPIPPGQPPHTRWSGAEWLEGRCRSGINVISSPEVVVRGSVQRAVGGYRPGLPHAGDLEMWLRIAAVADVAYVRRVPQACYRRHPASMLRTSYRSRLVDLRQRKGAFDCFFEHHLDLPDAARLHGLARRALAREALWAAARAYDRDRVEEAGAEELEAFALETFPEARSLPEHRALRRRRFLGPAFCSRTQIFAAPALLRRVQSWLWWQRWKRRGI